MDIGQAIRSGRVARVARCQSDECYEICRSGSCIYSAGSACQRTQQEREWPL